MYRFLLFILLPSLLYAGVLVKNSGEEISFNSLSDGEGNEILLATSKDGTTLLIPFGEVQSLKVNGEDANRIIVAVTYNDGTEDVIYVDKGYTLKADDTVLPIDVIKGIYKNQTLSSSSSENTTSSEFVNNLENKTEENVVSEESSAEEAPPEVAGNQENVSLFENTVNDSSLNSSVSSNENIVSELNNSSENIAIDNTSPMVTENSENNLALDTTSSFVKEESSSSIEEQLSQEEQVGDIAESTSSLITADSTVSNTLEEQLNEEVDNTEQVIQNQPVSEELAEGNISEENNESYEESEVTKAQQYNVVSEGVAQSTQSQDVNQEAQQQIEGQPQQQPLETSEKYLEYTIRRYDTLWDLAGEFLGNPFKWPEIWELNPYISNPDLIYPGDKLLIPKEYVSQNSILYNEELEKGASLEQRALFVNAPKYSFRDVSMFVKERRMGSSDDQLMLDENDKENLVELIEEERYPVLFKYAFLSRIAEMVNNDKYAGVGEIYVRDRKGRELLHYYEQVRLTVGEKDGVKVGDKYYVIDIDRSLKDNITHKKLPTIIKKKGEVKVIKVMDNYSVGVITRYYSKSKMIYNHDRIMKKNTLKVPRIKKVIFDNKMLNLYVVEKLEGSGNVISLPSDVFIVDGGKNKGVEIGQVYEIYVKEKDGDYSDLPVGECMVIRVFDDYSLVMLDARWSRIKLSPKDKLEYKFSVDLIYH